MDDRLIRPVFIVGPVRAGTTLLRLMVDHHPRINIFGEFEYAVHMCRTDDWPEPAAYRRWLEVDRAFQHSGLTMPTAEDYPSMARQLLAQHAARTDKEILGASVHTRIDLLPRLWPQAHFIHLLRDPRDVARSTIGMGWTGHVFFGVNIWIHAQRRWDRVCEQTAPEQRMELRYEELVRKPETELSRICDFLGVAYDSAMLDYARHTTYERPDPALTEQWRRKLTPREIALVEYRCGDLLTRRGYEPSGHPVTPPGALERLVLQCRNRWGMTRFALRRYGPWLWLRRFLAKRFGDESWRRRVKLEVNAVDAAHLR